MSLVHHVFNAFSWFAIAYTFFVDATYYLFTIMAFFALHRHIHTRTRERLERIFRSRLVPPISIVLPAWNEEATVVDSVRGMLRQLYSQYELIVVNDGSTDGTLARLTEAFRLERIEKTYTDDIATAPVRAVYSSYEYTRLTVVDKLNGGSKADAINAGINASSYPLFCACDADSLLEEDGLLQLAVPMLDRSGFVPASAGVVRAANGSRVARGTLYDIALPRRPIEIYQIIEYLRSFLAGRTAQSSMNIMLIVSGAFGLFNKAIVKEVGGYNGNALGEDFELIVRITKHLHEQGSPFEVVFVPQTVCWTMVPHDYATLGRQRARWHRGLLQTLLWNRDMVFSPAYGRTGIVGMGTLLLIEVLGPLVECLGYIMLPVAALIHAIAPWTAVLFFLISVFGGTLLSLSALLLEERSFQRYKRPRELERLIFYAIFENFGYRQLTLWWRTKASLLFLTNRRSSWGEMSRKSFS
ncbi:MAG: glycosyltransferase [Candidatus Baltobacteraceae bacterium]